MAFLQKKSMFLIHSVLECHFLIWLKGIFCCHHHRMDFIHLLYWRAIWIRAYILIFQMKINTTQEILGTNVEISQKKVAFGMEFPRKYMKFCDWQRIEYECKKNYQIKLQLSEFIEIDDTENDYIISLCEKLFKLIYIFADNARRKNVIILSRIYEFLIEFNRSHVDFLFSFFSVMKFFFALFRDPQKNRSAQKAKLN